jgi:hypothetical protein
MRTAALLVLLLASNALASPGASDSELLSSAERAFAEGTGLRGDSAQARPAFARAALAYDELWHRGHHGPDLALDRARAHRLANDLPGAVVALNEGLAAAPWNRPLQVALEDARAAVAYPLAGDLAAQCRPAPAAGIGTRMSPAEGWLLVGLLWLLACAAVARFAMTRRPVWLGSAAAWAVALAVLGGFWWQHHRQHRAANEHPLVVLAEDAVLRKGNADAYPPRLEGKLPRGAEARELTRRGGWVQVQLAGGAVGWLPESSVLPVKSES